MWPPEFRRGGSVPFRSGSPWKDDPFGIEGSCWSGSRGGSASEEFRRSRVIVFFHLSFRAMNTNVMRSPLVDPRYGSKVESKAGGSVDSTVT